ncbi:hypothetical protein I6E68_04560 [Salinibacterium sp. NSLL150]|nr:hypothetical protein [Salinibacterium sp. NSLL35]MBH0101168.1 hypothetical protein [Salinibacterium sp. NSLL150]MBH0103927.1 hypothetical protein [Salinibacterium sp. NSLL16]MBH0106688.1 hypothetical protein [Salinibacterium sp. NSLL17]MBH0109541.1 hypothetical protein [Salinibacterium sp. NG22]
MTLAGTFSRRTRGSGRR